MSLPELDWTDKKNGAAAAHYPTMTFEELARLPLSTVAAENCVLLQWTTGPKLDEGVALIREWKFEYKTVAFLWRKTYRDGRPYMGLGFYTRSGSEFVLLGTRGRVKRKSMSVLQVIEAPVRGHSAKPDEFYARVERLFDGPYLDLFARRERYGWFVWGDEVGPFHAPEVSTPAPPQSSGPRDGFPAITAEWSP